MGERNLPRVQIGEPRGVPVRRGLAPLDERLSEPERRCAECLREMRQRTGLTSEELAERLGVDRTRLSKFLNGREVPRLEIVTRLHRLAAECEGVEVSQAEASQIRALVYAAACVRSPLQAREFELAAAREDLDLHRAEALQQMADLQRELHDERKRRQDAEDALEEFAFRSREENRALVEERDAALERITQLEDQIRQAGAVLRLRERDAETLDQITRATDAELALWESNGTGDLAGICATVVYLRDADEDDAADRLIEQIVLGHPVADVVRLVRELSSMKRFNEAVDAEHALARRRKPIDLFRWFCAEDRFGEARSDFMKAMVIAAPGEHLVRFYKACKDHGETALEFDLLKAMVERGRVVVEGGDGSWFERFESGLAAVQHVLAQQTVSEAGSTPAVSTVAADRARVPASADVVFMSSGLEGS
ncbi:helix-turn-helix domain-containing protein [Kitasatospora sp. NPDC096204]|uniref:helix-turn-helix domain-containing protein n=1 Tax=Kitasatospora sp. NPDC096204 TaxID=3364094 RepID=UPI00381C24EE